MDGLQELAAVLGLAHAGALAESPFRFIDRVEKGLPLSALERLTGLLTPADNAFKYRLVPKASLARRKLAKRLSSEESVRLARVARIWAQARAVWGSDEEARGFLFRPHPLLEEQRPIDVTIASELGSRVVEEVLGRLQYGSAA